MANVYVRIAVPDNQTNALEGDYGSIGHYDLIIDQEINYCGHFGISKNDSSVSMIRPVFSWGTDHKLTIKPLAIANKKDKCKYYMPPSPSTRVESRTGLRSSRRCARRW